ncbi:unnamed protein product [Rotaria sp. Silwood2]|nr:unnamed protein product [Rotaria sp. Silwood2]
MDQSIEEMMVRASQAIGCGQLHEAVELCSKMIFIAEGGEDKKLSVLYSYRAGYRLLTKEFNLALQDCDKAIDLDQTNTNAYIHKW